MIDKVSVIIPVYNAEQYLKKCLDSIVQQTYINIEIIIVNDGSIDGSKKICEEYCRRDLRVKLYNQQNQGVSSARNKGISVAVGKYITFIDADDYISPRYVEVLLNNIKNTDSDISICGSTYNNGFEENTGTVQTEMWNRESAFVQLVRHNRFHLSVWGKLYKSEVVSELLFENINIGEDQIFLFQAIMNSRKIVFQNIQLYCYYQHDGSAMNSAVDKRYLDVIYMADRIYEEGTTWFPELSDLFYAKKITTFVGLIFTGFRGNIDINEAINNITFPEIHNCKFMRIAKNCSVKQQAKFLLVKYMPFMVRIYVVGKYGIKLLMNQRG